NCTLYIVHTEREDRTYANIETILPPEKHNNKLDWYGIESISGYVRAVERPGYLQPEAYSAQRKSA
ncbi:hypothetical protein RZS08_46880, partial [Arthrospira platensis SPKY1]|nr:hypothetical protein [Arthrospira platensis SPKY1]